MIKQTAKEMFKLYLDGNGEDTIARIMQEEQHLNCTAYWASKDIDRGGKKSQIRTNENQAPSTVS